MKDPACQAKLNSDAPPDTSYVPEGVCGAGTRLMCRTRPWAASRSAARSPGTAYRGIPLCAAMLGADADDGSDRRKSPEVGWGACQITGQAVRVADPDAQKRLRWKWYAEEVSAPDRRYVVTCCY